MISGKISKKEPYNHNKFSFLAVIPTNLRVKSSIIKNNSSTWIYGIFKLPKIDWNAQFDAVIIGHVKELVSMFGDDFVCKIIKNAIIHGKNLYVHASLYYMEK